MDKKQIEALQNLAYAFEDLLKEMSKKNAAEENSKSGGMFGFFKMQAKLSTTLKSISNGVKKIGNDTKKILSGQESLINMSKEIRDAKEKKNIFSRITDKDNKSKVKEGTKVIVLMAGAILAIGGAFKLIGKVDFASVMALAFALPLVAIAFAKIAEHKELSGKEIFKVLLTIVGLSMAIAASSYFLSMVVPLSFSQFLTAVGIAAAFAVISYGIGELAKDLKRVDVKSLAMLPLAMVLIAAGIVGSSMLLQYTAPIQDETLWTIAKLALVMGIASLLLGPAMFFLGKMPLTNILMGGLAIVALAGTIFLSSLLLNMGNYENYPSLGWTIGAGAAMLAFSIPMVILGMIAVSGVGALALLAGAIAVLGVAATIVGVSHILSEGKYDTYPGLGWAMGVGLSLVAFGGGMAMLGTIIVASFGLGAVALAAGSDAVKSIAQTIVDVSFILDKGNYKGGPTSKWAGGISLALGAFAPVYQTLMQSKALSIFGAKEMSGQEYANVMTTIALSIIKVAQIFNKGGVSTWKNAPTETWAKGVGLAIGAFAPVYASIQTSLGDMLKTFLTGKSEDKTKTMTMAMESIARSIISVAQIFNSSPGKYSNAPSESWAKGVGVAVESFANIYKVLEDFDSLKMAESRLSLMKIISSIFDTSKLFSAAKTLNLSQVPISPEYMKSIRSNVEDFVGLTGYLEENTISGVGAIAIVSHIKSILAIAKAYDVLGNSLSKLNNTITALKGNQLENVKMISQNILVINKDDTGKDQIVSIPMPSNSVQSSVPISTNNQTSSIGGSDATVILQEMNRKLGVIANNSSNLSSYVNELRSGGDISLKH